MPKKHRRHIQESDIIFFIKNSLRYTQNGIADELGFSRTGLCNGIAALGIGYREVRAKLRAGKSWEDVLSEAVAKHPEVYKKRFPGLYQQYAPTVREVAGCEVEEAATNLAKLGSTGEFIKRIAKMEGPVFCAVVCALFLERYTNEKTH